MSARAHERLIVLAVVALVGACDGSGAAPCATAPWGASAGQPTCLSCDADGTCGASETCRSCPADCGECPAAPIWRAVPSPTRQILRAVRGSGRGDAWAAGEGGALLRLLGKSAAPVDSGTDAALVDLWSAGPGDTWVVGQRGTVLRAEGAGFAQVPHLDFADALEQPASFAAVGGTAPEDVWLLPESAIYDVDGRLVDVVLRRDGALWRYSERPACDVCIAYRMAVIAADEVWVVNGNRPPQRYGADGWAVLAPPGGASLVYFGIWGDRPDNVWIAAEREDDDRGVVLQWDGQRWTAHDDPLVQGTRCRGVWGHEGSVWLACLGGAVLRFDDAGWALDREPDGGPALLDLWGSGADEIWAVGVEGTLLRRSIE